MGELCAVHDWSTTNRGEGEFRVDKWEARKTLRDDYLKCKLILIKEQDKHFRKNFKSYHWLYEMLEKWQLPFEPNAQRLNPDLLKPMAAFGWWNELRWINGWNVTSSPTKPHLDFHNWKIT